uniref:Uncharacterized protein n=1 Tax=Romanomermis culicivorax TaxID=13658 RepID=A0A915I7M5_ROMCU
IACNALAWSEWICSGSCGQPKSYRERFFKAGTRPYPSEFCVFVETKDCPPEMVRGGGRMTCPETVTVPAVTTTLTPPPSMTTMISLLTIWTSQDMIPKVLLLGTFMQIQCKEDQSEK